MSTKSPSKKERIAKAPKPLEERLTTLFKSLCSQLDGGHFRNALKTCDRILRLKGDDQDVLQTKMYLLLQLERYSDALSLATALQSDMGFELVYCMYRLQREDDAVAALETLKSSDSDVNARGIQHLAAQLSFRRSRFTDCQVQYSDLLSSCPNGSDEYDDVLNNLSASQTHVDFITSGYQEAIHRLAIPVAKIESGPPPLRSFVAPAEAPVSTLAARPSRKSRLPKHVIPGVTPLPDPERWLKKRDRTKEARKGKKGRKEGMGAGATQGIAVGTVPSTPSRPTPGNAAPGKKKKSGK